ncbi:uncharacterized protein LOC111286637 [Durio zibethinus]|uniref:Uncharacterized protein LOC111286637 n=1 Tax=Durio zibethinus TaxID=66656 RepID=A0A6P5XXC0_DURZI|nr:uncharacterized protein LOC111286637 [Durio zibethinus]
MATNIPISLPSLQPSPSFSKSRSHFSQNSHNSSLAFGSLSLSTSRKAIHFRLPFELNHQNKSNKLWITFATPEEVLPSDSTPLDNSEQIVSTTGDEGVAIIIQVLLFVAFVALIILTIGVIYIGVQDFLEKREREKFEKEEASNEKKGKKKKKVKTRDGPRGFGQKIDEDDDV